MTVVFALGKCLLAYFGIMLVTTNLLGFFVRSLFPPTEKGSLFGYGFYKSYSSVNYLLAVIVVILYSVFVYFLYRFFDSLVTISALLLTLARLPDLLWEMRNGARINKQNMPKRLVDYLFIWLYWIPLPLLFYSFLA
jgi:hypothetical protein